MHHLEQDQTDSELDFERAARNQDALIWYGVSKLCSSAGNENQWTVVKDGLGAVKGTAYGAELLMSISTKNQAPAAIKFLVSEHGVFLPLTGSMKGDMTSEESVLRDGISREIIGMKMPADDLRNSDRAHILSLLARLTPTSQ